MKTRANASDKEKVSRRYKQVNADSKRFYVVNPAILFNFPVINFC